MAHKKSFETLVAILDNYSNSSGIKYKKCQVLRIGSMINNEDAYLKRKFKWSTSKASSLRFTFFNDNTRIFQANLEPIIVLFEKCLKQWQHRKLTLMSKITVIKNALLKLDI